MGSYMEQTINTKNFDSLQYYKHLLLSGFTEKQAEGQTKAFSIIFENNIATKKDLHDEIGYVRSELKNELKSEIKSLEIKFGRMLAASVIFTVTILGFLMHFIR